MIVVGDTNASIAITIDDATTAMITGGVTSGVTGGREIDTTATADTIAAMTTLRFAMWSVAVTAMIIGISAARTTMYPSGNTIGMAIRAIAISCIIVTVSMRP